MTIAGKAIGVNLMRSEWAVSACQAGIYSRSPGELFLTLAGHTHTHTHLHICTSANTRMHVQPVNDSFAEYLVQLLLLVGSRS